MTTADQSTDPAVPRITVITPSFNQAKFIERTIHSVLDQRYPDLEYLIVDGGSTDGSVGIIERFDSEIAWWVSEPDEGQTHALNKALRRATGEIVAYINSDDYYLPGALETAARVFERSDADWVVGASRFEDTEGEEIETWVPSLPEYGRPWWIRAPWGVPQPSSFWRREVFNAHGPFRQDLHYVFDTEHGLRLALNGSLPELIDEVLAVRVLHGAAKSADIAPFQAERAAFPAMLRGYLRPAERVSLELQRLLARLISNRGLSWALEAQRAVAAALGLSPDRVRENALSSSRRNPPAPPAN